MRLKAPGLSLYCIQDTSRHFSISDRISFFNYNLKAVSYTHLDVYKRQGNYHGNVTVREALNRSLNTVAWQILEDIGVNSGLRCV